MAISLALIAAAPAQTLDCGQLQHQIAQADRGGRSAQISRRIASDLARAQGYAQQLGCSGFSFFGGNPQCDGVKARIEQLRTALAQAQQGSDGGRSELIARFNAYCRGGAQPAPQTRGFFESLFGIGNQPQAAAPPPPPEPTQDQSAQEEGGGARGGSQAVCVRTCDGGFFPLPISSRHKAEDLTQMCQALCPGTETAVYSRNPNSEIKTAVSLDGKPYVDLPNALLFQKSYSATCSCRPAGKSWAEALANADQVLDNTRKGDIVVTAEKSAELSRAKGSDGLRLHASDPQGASQHVEIHHLAPPSTTPSIDDSAPDQTATTGGQPANVRRVGPQF